MLTSNESQREPVAGSNRKPSIGKSFAMEMNKEKKNLRKAKKSEMPLYISVCRQKVFVSHLPI